METVFFYKQNTSALSVISYQRLVTHGTTFVIMGLLSVCREPEASDTGSAAGAL